MIVSLRRRLFLAASVVLAVNAPISAWSQAREPVTVFAGSSLKNVMDDVAKAYASGSHGVVRFSYGASSALARQIEQGAPADIFISADTDWMDYLAKRKLIVAESRRNLLTNHLALVAPAASAIRLRVAKGMPIAAALGSGRLAIAGPEVPAGKYAQASLTALGVWDGVKDKLARAENVRATLAFVARGETPLGVVYDTDAKIEPNVRVIGLLPDDSHPAILYPVAVLSASINPDARPFVRFLDSSEARALYRKYGFVALRGR